MKRNTKSALGMLANHYKSENLISEEQFKKNKEEIYNKPRDISKSGLEILKAMNNGWELGKSMFSMSNRNYYLQEGGLGEGGKAKNVHGNIISSLIKKGYIKGSYGFPVGRYYLTEKGRMI